MVPLCVKCTLPILHGDNTISIIKSSYADYPAGKYHADCYSPGAYERRKQIASTSSCTTPAPDPVEKEPAFKTKPYNERPRS